MGNHEKMGKPTTIKIVQNQKNSINEKQLLGQALSTEG